jgi:hypothetical protein
VMIAPGSMRLNSILPLGTVLFSALRLEPSPHFP